MMTVISGETMALSTSTSALFGYGVVSGFLLALTVAAQRWSWWLIGAIIYALSVDGLYRWLNHWLPLSDWECYVVAMGICWLPFALWILYRILRYGSVSNVKSVETDAKHSAIETDNFKPQNLKLQNMQFRTLEPKSITLRRIQSKSIQTRSAQLSQSKHNHREHSPVYDANFQPRFR